MAALESLTNPATLFIAGLIPVLWFLGMLLTPERQHGIFALSIASVILEHIRPWAYLTAPFYHQHLWEVACIMPLTFILGSRVEKHLGTSSFVRMIFFVSVVSTGLLFCDMFLLYIVFRKPFFLKTGVSGFTGGLVALLVALTHENPGQTLWIPRLPVKHYPLLLSLVCLCLTAGAVLTKNDILIVGAGPYALSGMYFGWFYLRFLHKKADGTFGDVSEAFGLPVLFPSSLQPSVAALANFCYSVAKLCGYFQVDSTLPISLPPMATDPVTERRKARAMKALDEKLAKMATLSTDPKQVTLNFNDEQCV